MKHTTGELRSVAVTGATPSISPNHAASAGYFLNDSSLDEPLTCGVRVTWYLAVSRAVVPDSHMPVDGICSETAKKPKPVLSARPRPLSKVCGKSSRFKGSRRFHRYAAFLQLTQKSVTSHAMSNPVSC